MKMRKKFDQLHDSIIEEVSIDPVLLTLRIVLGQGTGGEAVYWEVKAAGLLKISAASRFTVARDYVDVYDVVEIFDEECDEWSRRLTAMDLGPGQDLTVHKLLFASTVFDGDHGEGGMVVVCRSFKIRRI
jgi:hypothetical protein